MPTKVAAVTTIATEVRVLLRRSVERGWSATTIAAEMQKIGHKGWNATVVNAVIGKGRLLTIDEVVGLLAVLKASASLILREVDSVTGKIIAESKKGGRA